MPASPTGPSNGASASKSSLVLALLGFAISLYITIEHYRGSTTLACPESAAINCVKVTTSRWSHLAGIPVAVLGLAYFAAMIVLLLPRTWQHRSLDPVRVAAAVLGVAMVLYLLWIELFRIDAICLWCTAVHACTVALLATTLWHTSSLRSRHLAPSPT
jgi:uncharacterized membrane protein